jgi:hypothetical protein
MPSTYSSSLRLELQASGENANTWGTKTNNNLNLIEQAIAGYSKITLASASATYTLPIADASASEGRNAFIEFAGTVASAISVIVPEVEKGYWVRNSATGSTLTVRTSAGTGVTLPTNEWVFLISDGVSVYSTLPTSLTNYARLDTSQTFTGANTFTSAVTVSGPAAFASLVDIKGPTSLASTLVTNATATFNSNVSVSGTLYATSTSFSSLGVTGGATFGSNVSVSGSFTVSGAAVFTSAVAIRAPLSLTNSVFVSGAATLASTVDIAGATSLASTLTVGGVASFRSNVSVVGTFTVSGISTFTSTVNIKSELSVSGYTMFTSAVNFRGNDFNIGNSGAGSRPILSAVLKGGSINCYDPDIGGSRDLTIQSTNLKLDCVVSSTGGLWITSNPVYVSSAGIILGSGHTGGGSNVLAITNGTAPSFSTANGILLYAEDVSSSSELKVRDEAGNVTTLSPHNFSGCGGPSEEMAWSYYSERNGKFVNIDMMKLARLLEKLTGEKLVYIGDTP